MGSKSALQRSRANPSPNIAWPKGSPPPPAKLPARNWRDLIRQAWHTDPLRCPDCGKAMRFIALIEEPLAIEKILRHLNLCCGPATFAPARPPPAPGRGEVSEPQLPLHDGEFLIETSPVPHYENVLTD